MARITWGTLIKRRIEMGVSKCILYPNGGSGVAWNGVTAIHSTPEGCDSTDFYANNKLYGRLMSPENYKGSIEAYTAPKEFAVCDGRYIPVEGVSIGQQGRSSFNLCYRTEIYHSNSSEAGYKIHLIYNSIAAPSQKSYETMNDSPDAVKFSWDFVTNPVYVEGYRGFSEIVLDSTQIDWINLQELEKIIYGLGDDDPAMPRPEFILDLVSMNRVARLLINVLSMHGHWIWDTFNFLQDTVPIAIERESYRHIYKNPEPETEYIQPSISFELFHADKDSQQYLVNVIDEKNPSGLVSSMDESDLNLDKVVDDSTGEWVITQDSSGFYHYPYLLTI